MHSAQQPLALTRQNNKQTHLKQSILNLSLFMVELMTMLELKLTVNTAAIGIAAFMKTESRKEGQEGMIRSVKQKKVI